MSKLLTLHVGPDQSAAAENEIRTHCYKLGTMSYFQNEYSFSGVYTGDEKTLQGLRAKWGDKLTVWDNESPEDETE